MLVGEWLRSQSVVDAIVEEVKPHSQKMKEHRSILQKSSDAAKVVLTSRGSLAMLEIFWRHNHILNSGIGTLKLRIISLTSIITTLCALKIGSPSFYCRWTILGPWWMTLPVVMRLKRSTNSFLRHIRSDNPSESEGPGLQSWTRSWCHVASSSACQSPMEITKSRLDNGYQALIILNSWWWWWWCILNIAK